MGGNIVIEVKNLNISFKRKTIHKNVNISVNRGDIYSIIGKSGSGKSTLLRAMLMLQKFEGSIIILGTDIGKACDEKKSMIRRQFGVMFQAASLFTSLTIGENIAVSLNENVKLPKRMVEDIVKFKLSLVGLEDDVYYLYPSELSGGMKKKAALARALILDPQLLFLDEPTSGLDPVSAEDFDKTIRQLNKLLGITVVMVTHDLDSFFNVTTRCCVLGDKKVLAEGTPFDIIKTEDEWIKKIFFGERGIKFQKWNQKRDSY